MSKQQREVNRRERAAAVQKAAAAKERNRRLLITLAIVVVLSAVVAGFVIFSGSGDTTTASTASAPAKASGQALVVGKNDKAKYKVVVFEDFLCPFCRQFETSSRDFLRADAKKGTVQVEYRPFHLLQDDYSTRALSAWAAVLQQGTPAQALKFHDLLYDNQPYEQDPSKPGASKLASWAKKSGVTSKSVLAATGRSDDAFVSAADAAATKAAVTATPTVFVNGKQLAGNSVSDMVDNLERTLAAG
jgi:protein-disulfide isomerase